MRGPPLPSYAGPALRCEAAGTLRPRLIPYPDGPSKNQAALTICGHLWLPVAGAWIPVAVRAGGLTPAEYWVAGAAGSLCRTLLPFPR
jgi:hypothetical protein